MFKQNRNLGPLITPGHRTGQVLSSTHGRGCRDAQLRRAAPKTGHVAYVLKDNGVSLPYRKGDNKKQCTETRKKQERKEKENELIEQSKATIRETHKLTLMRPRDLEGGGSLGLGRGGKHLVANARQRIPISFHSF